MSPNVCEATCNPQLKFDPSLTNPVFKPAHSHVLWCAVHDYARFLCPNLSSAYTFGKAAAEWFPLRQPHGIPIIWKCCHPEHIMRGANDSNTLMKFSKGIEVMVAAAQSFHSKSFSQSLMADDTLLESVGSAADKQMEVA